MEEKTVYYVFIDGVVRSFKQLPEDIDYLPRAERRSGIWEIPYFYNLPNGWVGKSYQSDKVILTDVRGEFSEIPTEKDYSNIFNFCKQYPTWDALQKGIKKEKEYKEKKKEEKEKEDLKKEIEILACEVEKYKNMIKKLRYVINNML